MDGKTWAVLLLVVTPAFTDPWTNSAEERLPVRNPRRGVHYHTKRHMLTENEPRQEIRAEARPLEANKRRIASPRNRKKPSGHLKPLQEDDMDNDEVVSVAIGPPPMRPKYDKINWKQKAVRSTTSMPFIGNYSSGATNLVQEVLMQLGREFVTHQVSEDFVFGQYIGNAMKNITSDLKLRMQHDILDIVVRYQKINRGELQPPSPTTPSKMEDRLPPFKGERKFSGNDTEESWPDFSNLAKIVG